MWTKEPLARKRIFTQTPFSHSTWNFKPQNFKPRYFKPQKNSSRKTTCFFAPLRVSAWPKSQHQFDFKGWGLAMGRVGCRGLYERVSKSPVGWGWTVWAYGGGLSERICVAGGQSFKTKNARTANWNWQKSIKMLKNQQSRRKGR